MTTEDIRAESRRQYYARLDAVDACPGHVWVLIDWEGPGRPGTCSRCGVNSFCAHEAMELEDWRTEGRPIRQWSGGQGMCGCHEAYEKYCREKAEREMNERRGRGATMWFGPGEGEPWRWK